MNFNDWLDEQTKQINTYFTRKSKMKDLIKQLEVSTSLEWKEHEETGGLVGDGHISNYWLDVNKDSYDLGISYIGDIVQLYGVDLDNVILEVNKNEVAQCK